MDPTPYTVFVIPHTHWDREWYATFQQFRIRLVHVMDALLALLLELKEPGYTGSLIPLDRPLTGWRRIPAVLLPPRRPWPPLLLWSTDQAGIWCRRAWPLLCVSSRADC